MGIVESWWNGNHGWIAKRRVRLCHYGRWTVELIGPWKRDEVVECRDEDHAREVTRQALDEAPDDQWRRLDHLHQPPPASDGTGGADGG